MSNTTPLDDEFEILGVSTQLQALLERYEQWTNRDNCTADERILLRDSICNPTKTLWLHACRRALENNNTAWLQFYDHYDGGSERKFPLSTLEWDDFEKRRTHAAVCLANCALAAAALKTATGSQTQDAVSQFVASFENALIHWQASGNSQSIVPLRSQPPPPLLAVDSFLDEIKQLYARANEEFEVSPVEALIRHFLRIDSHRSQPKPSKTALFPLVFRVGGNAIALFEVDRYDHGTGRLYRDAVTSAFVIADDEFYESLQTAFEYIKNQNGDVENYDFYWRVRIWNRKNSGSLVDSRLLKQSAGLAASIAVNDSMRNSDLGAGYLFTGKVNSDGTFGVVGDLEDKINLAESNDLPIFIPRITDPNGRATMIVSRSDKVRLASSFVDVTQIIQSERQALKDENYRRLRRRRMIRIGIVAPILVLSIVLGLIAWGYSLEKKRRELAEFEKNIAERENEELKVARQALNTTNAELNDTNALLDKANEELDSKNRKLIRTNAALEIATNEAVANEQEAQKLRQIAQASNQAAIASQFATEGYKRLVHGDKSGAKSYLAKALTFDDQEDYRTGLLNAHFDSGINSYKLAWTADFDGQSSCCLKTAMSHSGAFLATTTIDRMQVRIIKTDDGSEVSTVRLPKKIADIALSTTGEMLATKTDDGQVSVWQTGSQKKIFEYMTQPDESLNSLVFSTDSIYLAVVSGTHSVLVSEIASGQIVKHFDNSDGLDDAKISYVNFIPGNYVAYSFRYGPIIIAPVKTSAAPTRINAWNYHLGLGYTQRGELITSAADITVYPDITKKLGAVSLPDFESTNQKVRNDWLIASNSSVPYYSTTNDNGIIHIRMGSEVVGQIAFPMGKPVNLMIGSNGNLLFQNYEAKFFAGLRLQVISRGLVMMTWLMNTVFSGG